MIIIMKVGLKIYVFASGTNTVPKFYFNYSNLKIANVSGERFS